MQGALNRLQLRHYRLIHAIAACGQLSHAATRLGLSQPAASRSLSEIERSLGETVFERGPRGMTPTPLGEVLVRHAGALVAGVEETAKEVAAFRSGRAGSVRVGAVTGAAVAYLVPAIRSLKAETPRAEIRVDVAPSVELIAGLVTGEYDFALCRVPPGQDRARFEIQRGEAEVLEILVRGGHPLAGARDLTLARLAGYPWVLQSRGMPVREAVEQAFLAEAVAPPEDIVDTASLIVTLAYLESSDAVAPVPREVAALLAASAAAPMVRLAMPPITMTRYHLIRDVARPESPLALRLRARVADAMV
ncbi:MAG: LysR family transcriptional regulator [Pseudomonadota bacterium]